MHQIDYPATQDQRPGTPTYSEYALFQHHRNSPKGGAPAENPRPFPVLGPVRGSGAPEEGVVFHAFLPEVFALISVLEVELDRVLVVALQGRNEAIATRGMRDRYNFGSINCHIHLIVRC